MKEIPARRNRLLLASVIIILIATLTPSGNVEVSMPYVDKIVHFALFLFLSININYKYQQNDKVIPMLLWAILFGLLTEVFQQGVPGRDMDLFDGIADTLGVIAGYYFYRKFGDWLDRVLVRCGA